MISLLASLGIFSFVEGIGTVQAILFIVGLVLMLIEVFTPGYGIAGGAGVVLIIIGIILTASNLFEAMMMVFILLVIIAVLLAIIIRSARRGRLSKKLILKNASSQQEGFSSTVDYRDWVGKTGTALTMLRPSGTGLFDGKRLDVVSAGSFIDKDAAIKIVYTEGRRVVVEDISQSQDNPTP